MTGRCRQCSTFLVAFVSPTGWSNSLLPAVHEGTEEGVQARAMGGLRSFYALSATGHLKDSCGLGQIIDMDRSA